MNEKSTLSFGSVDFSFYLCLIKLNSSSQPMKSKTTIDRNDLMKIERKVRRDTAIKNDIPHFGHQVHKSKKDYNRCALKRELKNLY